MWSVWRAEACERSGLSILFIVLVTELGILQNLLSMVNLGGEQWLICIGVALTLLVVEEVRKFLKVRAGHELPEPTTSAATAPASAAA